VPVVSVAIVAAVISYISINGDKYFRNNSHCNYWHHWHHRHNSYSDHWNNGKHHRAIHSYISSNGDNHCSNNCQLFLQCLSSLIGM
jgi:hypothetical protein